MSRPVLKVMILFAVLAGCSHSKAIREESAAANAKYDQMKAESEAPWNRLIAGLDKWREYLIPTAADNVCPETRVDSQPWVNDLVKLCQDTNAEYEAAAKRKSTKPQMLLALENKCLECWSKFSEIYADAISRTYYKADFDWANERLKENPKLDIECVLTYSHNQTILAYIAEKKRLYEAYKTKAGFGADELRQQELAEIKAKHSGPSALQVIGVFLQSAGQGMQRSSQQSNSSSYSSTQQSGFQNSSSCTSDVGCGPGSICVKPNFSSSGICMKSVDQYGLQRYDMPRPNTGPKMPSKNDCHFDAECPIGFRCDTNSGTCAK